jgi:TetR/AcrR family transcriptional regulator, transcriptional repressor of aconitase
VPRVSEAHLAARRRQILDAAHAVFTERGFARTSMDDVARAANLSIGAVYRYFPGKDDLILAVCSGHGDDPDDTQESAAALLARLAGYVLPGGGHAKFAVQVWAEAALSPRLAAALAATHGRLQSRLARLIAQRADGSDPLVASTDTHAQVALAALIGLAALVAAGVPVDEDRFIGELADFTRVQ